MSDIIKNWLTARLGIILDFSPEYFGNHCRDGRLIASLLHSYAIINQDQLKTIVATESSTIALKNLQYISNWLRYIDIECSPIVLREISHGKSSTAVRLFYQLFLSLESKDRLHFVTLQKQRTRFTPLNTKFEIRKVREQIQDTIVPENNPLSKPLKDEKDLIAWYKNKYIEIENKLNETRTKCLTKSTDQRQASPLPLSFKPRSISFAQDSTPPDFEQFQVFVKKFEAKYREKEREWTYEELDNLMRKARAMKVPGLDLEQANKYIECLRNKLRLNAANRKLKTKLETMLLNDLWMTVMEKQENEFDNIVSMKTLKQSQYEKQMTTKCFNVRHQKHIITENRKMVENIVIKKREDEFCRAVLDRQDNVNRVQKRFVFEKHRANELHERLYAEKLRRKYAQHYETCNDIVLAFMDVAVKTAQYRKQYTEDVPFPMQRNWKILFLSGRSIYELVERVEAIVLETADQGIEEIVHLELDRHDILNEADLQNYLKQIDPWDVDVLIPNLDRPENFYDYGLQVLGHIIHKLLAVKYPKPEPPIPPELPPFSVAACLSGITEFGMMGVLQELLHKRDIILIEVPLAINYCLRAFKDEMIGVKDVEIKLQCETQFTLNLEQRPATTVSVKTDPKVGHSVSMHREAQRSQLDHAKQMQHIEEHHRADQTTQTPKKIPEEDAVAALSEEAVLGKYAYEAMSLGKTLTNHVIAAMIVAYLKTLGRHRGWALINYPNNMDQAAALEFAITAKSIDSCVDNFDDPDSGISQFSDRFKDEQDELSVNIDSLQKSQLVPDPHQQPFPESYITFMTAFVTLKLVKKETEKSDKSFLNPSTSIEEFYMDQGVNYTLYYSNFDFMVLKKLARMIIGDYQLPIKSSIQLFGAELEQLEARYGVSKGKAAKSSAVVHKLLSADQTTVSLAELSGEDTEEVVGETESVHILPGDPSYVYVALPQPESLVYGLATVWENIETIYLTDMKQLFFIKRIHRNTIVPYITYVREHTDVFIKRPDLKQEFVDKFQRMYNDLEADLREDEEVQAELHCRLREFRNKLWAICDVRMQEAEMERQRIIHENWIADQLVLLCNLFIATMQVEVDRCADTIQLIQDYYFVMLKKLLDPEERIAKLELVRVETIKRLKIDVEVEKFHSSHAIPTRSKPPKEYTPDGIIINEKIAQILLVPEPKELQDTPFVSFIVSNIELCTMQIDGWSVKYTKVIQDNQATFNPAKAKPKGHEELDNSAEICKLFEEWMCAFDSEITRVKLRLRLLHARAIIELTEILTSAQITFHGIYRNIAERYDLEIKSVSDVCHVFGLAFEQRVRIQPQLVLDGDKFVVRDDTLLFPHVFEPIRAPQEGSVDNEFSIVQLTTLRNIFHDMTPAGSVPERTFLFLLQDMIVHNVEDGAPALVPVLWTRLTPDGTAEVLASLFGDSEYIDWRDFIVYNMCIPFPTEQQVLKAWMTYGLFDEDHCEMIHRENFNKISLWFERITEPHLHNTEVSLSTVVGLTPAEEVLRVKRIKELLFRMFQVKKEFVNYTALLLAFCKDINPVVGLAKAFTMSMRSLVCWNYAEGEEYEKSLVGSDTMDHTNTHSDSTVDDGTCLCGTTVLSDFVDDEDKRQDSSQHLPEFTKSYENVAPDPEATWYGEEEMEPEEMPTVSLSLTHAYSDEDLAMYKERVYLLPFEVILSTLAATLPWHVRTQCIENNSLRELLQTVYEELETPAGVYAHKFFAHPTILEIFKISYKFQELSPSRIVQKHLDTNA